RRESLPSVRHFEVAVALELLDAAAANLGVEGQSMTVQSVRARRAAPAGIVAVVLRSILPTLLTLVAAPSAFAQTLTGLSLTPANAITMQQGQVVQFVATAHYSNGATAD